MLRNLIVDTNLLLLWIIGSVDSGSYLRASNRLDKFNYDDFSKVNSLIGQFDALYITPYIATEISNLIDLDGYAKKKAFQIFKSLLEEIKVVVTDLRFDSEGINFHLYGLTDNSLVNLVQDYYILTDDSRLCVPLFSINPSNVLPYEVVKYSKEYS
ncbi:hypothetical protein I6M74_20970 [Acinetobacter bereziniae]|uniref:hypothetical protein n=1 Tax=Acinetobacter bereziniae TaxID=106648 RepID=UPI001901E557|nr:hypothetical protein [Acinetobacter bereziniae]MBJ8424347.1 hypothetical protein [Acinetobacter bereziniae]